MFHITHSWKNPKTGTKRDLQESLLCVLNCEIILPQLPRPDLAEHKNRKSPRQNLDKRFSHGGLPRSVVLIVSIGDFSHPMLLTTGCDAGHCPWRTGSTIEGTAHRDASRLFMVSRIRSRSSTFLSACLLSVYFYTNPAETSPTRSRKRRASG